MVASVLLMFLFTFVEPGYYSRMMGERDLMHWNISLYGFIAFSSLVLLAGAVLSAKLPSLLFRKRRAMWSTSLTGYLLGPTLVAILLLALTFDRIIHNAPSLFALLNQSKGSELKTVFGAAASDAWTGSFPFALGIGWWGFHHLLEYGSSVPRSDRVASRILQLVLILAIVVASAVVLSRFVLMPLMFGLMLIYVKHYVAKDSFRSSKLLLLGILGVVVMLGFFAVASRFRGANSSGAVVKSAIGYGPASMNRCAAVLDGSLDNSNLSDYLFEQNFGFIENFPFISRLRSNSYFAGQKTQQSIYDAIASANLNEKYIWLTSYGEIFLQFGSYYFLYVFAYGFLVGRFWRAFKRSKRLGIVLYPWAAFNVMYIFGSNFFASRYLSILLMLVAALVVYDVFLEPQVFRRATGADSSGSL